MDNSYNFHKESELVQQAAGLIDEKNNHSNSELVYQPGGQLNQKTYKTCKV